MTKLIDYADILRSKNAGPFQLTFDVLFTDKERYKHFKEANPITREWISKTYSVEPSLIEMTYVDKALGFKFTIPRKVSSGSAKDSDIYGAQQHGPLIDLEILI